LVCVLLSEEIADRTKANYKSKQKNFTKFVAASYPGEMSGAEVKLPLTNNQIVIQYLTTKTYKRGDVNQPNTAGTIQLEISAIKDLYRQRNIEVGRDLEREMERFSKGIRAQQFRHFFHAMAFRMAFRLDMFDHISHFISFCQATKKKLLARNSVER
jgi:hypothetical protein